MGEIEARKRIIEECFVPSLGIRNGEAYYIPSGVAVAVSDCYIDSGGVLVVDGELHLFGDLEGEGELKGIGEVIAEG